MYAGEARNPVAKAKIILLGAMTTAVQETYLGAVHPSRLRNPQPAKYIESSGETLTQYHRNVAEI